MNGKELTSLLSDIKPHTQYSDDIQIDGICDLKLLRPHHILCVKSKKFALLLKDLKPADCQDIILILGKDNWLDESLYQQFKATLICPSVETLIFRLSDIFYHRKMSGRNQVVDGRQMGTAEIHPSALVGQGAFIGENVILEENVMIHPGASIGAGVRIQAGSEIFSNVTIYPDVQIGKNVRIHAGSVIGADGFGYVFGDGAHQKIWHMGSVVLEDNVEIGANSCVDGGTFSPTRIGAGTKLDNHVQIGHNCQLGLGVIICGHVAIGGSSTIGDFTVFGGKSGMGDNMTLGPACQVAGGSLVNCDWPAKTVLGGHPARPLKEWMKGVAFVRRESLKKKLS